MHVLLDLLSFTSRLAQKHTLARIFVHNNHERFFAPEETARCTIRDEAKDEVITAPDPESVHVLIRTSINVKLLPVR